MDDLLSIGELARRSGLSVSALRFYDRERVLVPTVVDPATGYRRYTIDQVRTGAVIASLRRVQMSVDDIRTIVELGDDTGSVVDLLDLHLGRLEDGFARARREIAAVKARLADDAAAIEVVVSAPGLLRALNAVRFAAGDDPAYPMLHAIQLRLTPKECRVVATDRYRLAMHRTACLTASVQEASAASYVRDLVVPLAWIDEVMEVLTAQGDSPATLHASGGRVRVDCGPVGLETRTLDVAFPDVDILLGAAPTGTATTIDLGQLQKTEDARTLLVDDDTHVNRAFLLEAVTAAGGQATLRLDGPIAPLAIHGIDGAMSLLMPIRPEDEDGRA